ncbi:MAG: proline--tRNA ligase, partial [Armatimonadota bacterium]
MSKAETSAISPTRAENYPEWYQAVVRAADLAENSPVRGCMVIKPWGYAIWELIQRQLDDRIKATGHENAYFPLFIPLSFLQKEAEHVEGFAKECAVVTHHRLEMRDGRLVPAAELEEPLVVRPTSETVIGDSFARWVQSYRDLPLLINQWANVVRWEMRPRLFLRTAEFLWQEGHTAHATEAEAREETLKMLEVYRSFAEDVLALPVIPGEKPENERFPGAVNTYSIEAMMQDGKALQAGTSHYLGQNFSRAAGIEFLDSDGQRKFAYTTSWGVSTRLIGGVVMTHADDDGLRLPPRIAPKHAVVLPVIPKPDQEAAVLAYADEVAARLSAVCYDGQSVRVSVDRRDLRGGEKNWQWVKKGAPLRLEVGPRDVEGRTVALYRRDRPPREKEFVPLEKLVADMPGLLQEIQDNLFRQALEMRQSRT